jgi:DNA-binding MarR family transcriptional regulator
MHITGDDPNPTELVARGRAGTDDPNATELAARLRRAVVRLSRQLRRHAASGLSPSLDSALAVIGRRGPLSPSELAELEDVRRPTATRLIGALEFRGLVERSADPADGRSHRVAATGAGRILLAQARSRRNAYLCQALGALADDELAAIDHAVGLLERLVEQGR